MVCKIQYQSNRCHFATNHSGYFMTKGYITSYVFITKRAPGFKNHTVTSSSQKYKEPAWDLIYKVRNWFFFQTGISILRLSFSWLTMRWPIGYSNLWIHIVHVFITFKPKAHSKMETRPSSKRCHSQNCLKFINEIWTGFINIYVYV